MKTANSLPKYFWPLVALLLALAGLAISQLIAPGSLDGLRSRVRGIPEQARPDPVPPPLPASELVAFTPALTRAMPRQAEWRAGEVASCALRTTHRAAEGEPYSLVEAELLCPGSRSYHAVGHGASPISWAERADGIRISATGTWLGQSPESRQLSLNFREHTGALSSPGAPRADLEMTLLGWSLPILGTGGAREPPGPRSALEVPLHVAARPTRITGRPPRTIRRARARRAEPCELWVRPSPPPEGLTTNCRVILRCGDTLIYGARDTGYSTCSRDERGHPAAAHDRERSGGDGDPEMSLNWPDRHIVISEDGWSASFELSPHPRCLEAARFLRLTPMTAGADSGESALPSSLSFAPPGVASLSGTGEGTLTLDCPGGRAVAEFLERGRYELEFGWGFNTIAGYRVLGDAYAPWAASRAAPERRRRRRRRR